MFRSKGAGELTGECSQTTHDFKDTLLNSLYHSGKGWERKKGRKTKMMKEKDSAIGLGSRVVSQSLTSRPAWEDPPLNALKLTGTVQQRKIPSKWFSKFRGLSSSCIQQCSLSTSRFLLGYRLTHCSCLPLPCRATVGKCFFPSEPSTQN